MISRKQQAESIEVVKEILNQISDNQRYYKAMATVTATVLNKTVVDHEQIECDIMFGSPNEASVGIYWDEHGHPDFNKKGLFKQMSSNYQIFSRLGSNGIAIKAKDYTLKVTFNT